MTPREYIVDSINGDYAFLKRIDIYNKGEPIMVAMALLPEGIELGSIIHWENFEYSLSK